MNLRNLPFYFAAVFIAVAGAVAAGARWVFCGPPGWKLTAALVVGGAAGASAANAVKQLLL